MTDDSTPDALPPTPLGAHLDMTLREWIERSQREIVFERVHCALKNVFDLWVLQEILWETKPEVVVEIGVNQGGTTLWLSDTLRNFCGNSAIVIAIDVERPTTALPENVHFLHGDSIAPETVGGVQTLRRPPDNGDGGWQPRGRARPAGAAAIYAASFRGVLLRSGRWHRGRDGTDVSDARSPRGSSPIPGGDG